MDLVALLWWYEWIITVCAWVPCLLASAVYLGEYILTACFIFHIPIMRWLYIPT